MTKSQEGGNGRRRRNGQGGALSRGAAGPNCPTRLTRPRCHYLTNWGDVDVEDPQPDGAHKPKPIAASETREGGGVRLVLTRAPENRGPEEFTLRTASGGESNLKVKSNMTGVDSERA